MSSGGDRVPLIKKDVKRNDNEIGSSNEPANDLEYGDAIQAANVGFSKVLLLAKPDAGTFIIATILLLIASTSSLLIPSFGGKIIDIVSRDIKTPEEQSDALNAVKDTILAVVLVVVVGSLSTAFRAWLFSSSSERVVARLRKELFGHLMQQEIAFYDVTRTGELLHLSVSDSCSRLLEMLALVVVPIISVAVRYFGRYLRELSHATQATAAEESFGAIRTVRSFAQESYKLSTYSEKVDETLKLGLRQAISVISIISSSFHGSLKVTHGHFFWWYERSINIICDHSGDIWSLLLDYALVIIYTHMARHE